MYLGLGYVGFSLAPDTLRACRRIAVHRRDIRRLADRADAPAYDLVLSNPPYVPAPPDAPAPTRRVTIESGGPVVVEGPVEVVTDDGTVAVSRRFAVAICTCRRSATYPWCDTSHRAHERPRRGDGGS